MRVQNRVYALALSAPPAAAPTAEPLAAHKDGKTMEVMLFGARRDKGLVILDLGIRSLVKSGVEIQADAQFILKAGGEDVSYDEDATARSSTVRPPLHSPAADVRPLRAGLRDRGGPESLLLPRLRERKGLSTFPRFSRDNEDHPRMKKEMCSIYLAASWRSVSMSWPASGPRRGRDKRRRTTAVASKPCASAAHPAGSAGAEPARPANSLDGPSPPAAAQARRPRRDGPDGGELERILRRNWTKRPARFPPRPTTRRRSSTRSDRTSEPLFPGSGTIPSSYLTGDPSGAPSAF